MKDSITFESGMRSACDSDEICHKYYCEGAMSHGLILGDYFLFSQRITILWVHFLEIIPGNEACWMNWQINLDSRQKEGKTSAFVFIKNFYLCSYMQKISQYLAWT